MKLKFEKDKKGEISVKINGEDFSTADYIKMIKEIKDKKKIEAKFGENISEEERNNVQSMLEDINKIKRADTKEDEEGTGEEINSDDIPF